MRSFGERRPESERTDPFNTSNEHMYRYVASWSDKDRKYKMYEEGYGHWHNDEDAHKYRERLRNLPYEDYLRTPHWDWIKKEALAAAGYRCQICYSRKDLDVHHRTYERLGNEQLIWNADVIVLCRFCHRLFHRRLAKHGMGPLPRQPEEEVKSKRKK